MINKTDCDDKAEASGYWERIENGWLHITVSEECSAQIPADFDNDTIPDKYIFNCEWCRDIINLAWRKHKST